MLFDLVVDALALVLRKANGASHIKGVISHLLPGWVTHLQYADDTMILIEKDDTSIANLFLKKKKASLTSSSFCDLL
jgi:hypothetical protein